MQTVKNLLRSDKDKKLGNHKVEIYNTVNEGGKFLRLFHYYSTVICAVNDTDKIFTIDSSYRSTSTSRACNSYRRELLALGYKEVEKVQ